MSLGNKFACCESRIPAIPLSTSGRLLTKWFRYPRLLWISLSKTGIRKCVSLGFPRGSVIAQILGTND
jgi:hypothetical protein